MDKGVVEVGAEVVEVGLGVRQQVSGDDQDRAADHDDRVLLVAAPGDAPIALPEKGVGLPGGYRGIDKDSGQVAACHFPWRPADHDHESTRQVGVLAGGFTGRKQQVGRHPFRWCWSVPVQFPGFEPMSSLSFTGLSSHEATGAARSTGPDTRKDGAFCRALCSFGAVVGRCR